MPDLVWQQAHRDVGVMSQANDVGGIRDWLAVPVQVNLNEREIAGAINEQKYFKRGVRREVEIRLKEHAPAIPWQGEREYISAQWDANGKAVAAAVAE